MTQVQVETDVPAYVAPVEPHIAQIDAVRRLRSQDSQGKLPELPVAAGCSRAKATGGPHMKTQLPCRRTWSKPLTWATLSSPVGPRRKSAADPPVFDSGCERHGRVLLGPAFFAADLAFGPGLSALALAAACFFFATEEPGRSPAAIGLRGFNSR